MMDLLEIRKKAKGMKEGSQEDAAPSASENVEPAAAEAAPAQEPEAPAGKKRARKKGAPKKAAAEDPAPEAAWEASGARAPEEACAGAEAETAEEAISEPHLLEEGGLAGANEYEAAAAYRPDEREGSEEVVEYLAFMLADEEYAVKVEDIKEIIRPQRTTKVPRTPGFVVGIISLRGVILPVFDTKKRLGFEDSGITKTTRVIVISDGASPMGMMVDRVTGVAKLRRTEIEPPPAVIGGVESEYLSGVGRQGERLIILFNTSRVLEMEGK